MERTREMERARDIEHMKEFERTAKMDYTVEREHSWMMGEDPVPLLGLGTYGLRGRKCSETVAQALDMGYRHLDTAQVYGNEKEVGEGIRNSGVSRDEVFITTKISKRKLNPEEILASTDESLRRLSTSYADLLLIHWPVPEMDLEACLDAMFGLKESGKIRHVGVSNFHAKLFRKAMDQGPVKCNQVEFSPYVDQRENLTTAKYAGSLITAYSPLAKGKVSRDDLLVEIGKVYQKTAAQVALRWLIQQGDVAVIPKAGGMEHLKENLQIFDFELSREDMEKISTLNT